MSDKKMEAIIIEKPQKRSGVYAIVNIVKKKVYVGETIDFYRRSCEHIRSMYGLENSSNTKLVEEDNKTFEFFPVLWAEYNKEKGSPDENREWLTHETIYMFLFRKYGFTLYNGEKDNSGTKRVFLFKETVQEADLYYYLKDKKPEYYGYGNWKGLITAAEQQLNEDMNMRFNICLEDFKKINDEHKYIEIWKKRLEKVKTDNNYLIVKFGMRKEQINIICRKLLSVHLSINDMKECGLTEKSVDEVIELVKSGKMDRIIVSKFGNYLNQGPMTILKTKVYDMQHNKLENIEGLATNQLNKENGVCFWALKRLPAEDTRNFLLSFEKDRESRYVIISYTPSKTYAMLKGSNIDENRFDMKENENIDIFFERMKMLSEDPEKQDTFIKEYAIDKKNLKNKKGYKYNYPEKMFPSIISKNEVNYVLLISELSYLKGSFEEPGKIYDFFKSHTESGGDEKELSNTISGQKSNCCAKLKDGMREELIDFLHNQLKEDSNGTIDFLIAKLEYPYIIAAR